MMEDFYPINFIGNEKHLEVIKVIDTGEVGNNTQQTRDDFISLLMIEPST
jgi:hypothetical protein